MRRFLPIALGLAASALTLFLLMPLDECQDLDDSTRDVIIGSQPICPEVRSRVGVDYSNDAFGSWVSNLAASVVGISIAVVLQQKLDTRTEETE